MQNIISPAFTPANVTSNKLLLTHAVNELTNVASMMNGSLKYIESSHPEVRCYKYWTDICSDSFRIQEILRSLTDYQQSGQPELTRTDLQKLLRNSCLACMPMTEGTEKTLTFTSRTNGPCLMLDAMQMRAAFINLIKNALEAISENGWVHIVLNKDSSKAIIQIQDNGCGIAPEALLKIFEPFVTGHPGSVGLGLAITKRILDAHKGSISISSLPDRGTTVTIALPLNGSWSC